MVLYFVEHLITTLYADRCDRNTVHDGDHGYLRSDGVLDAHHHDAGQVVQDVILIVPVGLAGLGREVPVRHADGAQALAGHGLDHLTHHLVAVLGAEGARLPLAIEDVRAPWKKKKKKWGWCGSLTWPS